MSLEDKTSEQVEQIKMCKTTGESGTQLDDDLLTDLAGGADESGSGNGTCTGSGRNAHY